MFGPTTATILHPAAAGTPIPTQVRARSAVPGTGHGSPDFGEPLAVPGPATPLTRLLASALDEVDVGVVLLDAAAQLLHANHCARKVLADGHPLQLDDRSVTARDARDRPRLKDALHDVAGRGMRRMLALGDHGAPDGRRLVALVPALPGVAALLLGRTQTCEELSLQCYARTHALTVAETRVLAGLGRGESPARIARDQGVKLSTVRTQIKAIREKTGVGSITDLVHLVASLPPMVGALRH